MTTDLLHRAAAKLRETAASTSPGTWRVTLSHHKKHRNVLVAANFITDAYSVGIPLIRPYSLPDRQWQALASPAIAEPLATWLEAEAARLERTAHPSWHKSVAPHAFAIARALLGEENA